MRRELLQKYLGDRLVAIVGEEGLSHLEGLLLVEPPIRAIQVMRSLEKLRPEEAPALAFLLRRLQRFLRAKEESFPELSASLLWEEHQLKALQASSLSVEPAVFLSVYQATLQEAMRRSTLFAVAKQPEAASFEGNAAIEKLHAPKWLAWRRAEREGKLLLSVTLPESEIEAQVSIHCEAQQKEVLSFLRPLLRQRALELLDEKATREAVEEAARSYRGLLTAPPLTAKELISFFVGASQQLMGALKLSSGKIESLERFDHKPNWQRKLLAWIDLYPAEIFVLPSTSVDQARLRELRGLLPGKIINVKPAGLSEARALLRGDETKLPKEISSALILARRALAPLESFGAIDPLALGLAEYQNDLPQEELRIYLEDVHASCMTQPANPQTMQATPAGKLNPLLRSLSDLKPGMEIEAEVVNLASFGAFVSMGLEAEGLIHISEISAERISSPSEVLRIGQRLRARVLSVDAKEQRVSLSLKEKSAPHEPRGSKASALEKLKKAFK